MMTKTTTLALMALALTGLSNLSASALKLVPFFELNGKNATFFKNGRTEATSTVRGNRTIIANGQGGLIAVGTKSACGTYTVFRCSRGLVLAKAQHWPNGTTVYRSPGGDLLVRAAKTELHRMTEYFRNGQIVGRSFKLGNVIGFRKANGELLVRAVVQQPHQHAQTCPNPNTWNRPLDGPRVAANHRAIQHPPAQLLARFAR